jgi:hypothetical protein
MNYFDLPNFQSWLRFFGWVLIKGALSFLQFITFTTEKILEIFILCTRMFQKFLTKIVFVIDHLPYAGVPIAKQDKIETIEVTALAAEIKIEFFDFTELKNQPDKFPHMRVIGKTGVGKTRFTEWIMDMLGGEQFVITPKKKPTDWVNHKVFGYPFNYQECLDKLKDVHAIMHTRYAEMEQGKTPQQINFACDEWKLINKNVASAKELMKDIIIVARDAKIRLMALAQGENVATWGLEGESDLEECFTTVRFGDFALLHCKFLRNRYRKDSEEFQYYSAVLRELESQGFRCCMVEKQPAKVPDLSSWKPSFRAVADSLNSVDSSVVQQLHKSLMASVQNHPETTNYQGFQPQNSDFEGGDAGLISAIKTAISEGRSVDWCAKNVPGLPGNYYSARARVEEMRQDYGF